MQVVAELPSLHQLSLRGCPIAEETAYPDNILQHLPGLDVLDSKKLVKSGMQRRSRKSAAAATATAGATPAATAAADVVSEKPSKATSKKASSDVQQRVEAGVQPSVHDTKAKAVGVVKDSNRKAKRRDEATVVGNGDDAAIPTPAKKQRHGQHEASDVAAASTAGKDVEGPQGTDQVQLHQEGSNKTSKKKSARKGHDAEKQAGQQIAQGRSFLADVLHPEDDPVPVKQAAATLSKPDAVLNKELADSGLLKVIDTLPSKQPKSKAGKHKSTASNAPSGSAAVELLQTGVGLNTPQVGLGSTSSWD